MSPKEKRPSPEFLALQRTQLDAKLNPDAPVGRIDIPSRGWIHTIRTALGMSQTQLARRLQVSTASVSKLEKRETAGAIAVASLRKVAAALDCDLAIAFVPRKGLQRTVEEQASRKARDERNSIVHTMRLEAQDAGVDQALSQDTNAESWLTGRAREIWD